MLLYDIKYSYLIQIICTLSNGFKYSDLIQIIFTLLYGCSTRIWFQLTNNHHNHNQVMLTQSPPPLSISIVHHHTPPGLSAQRWPQSCLLKVSCSWSKFSRLWNPLWTSGTILKKKHVPATWCYLRTLAEAFQMHVTELSSTGKKTFKVYSLLRSVLWFLLFNGISTFVGYLMPKLFS